MAEPLEVDDDDSKTIIANEENEFRFPGKYVESLANACVSDGRKVLGDRFEYFTGRTNDVRAWAKGKPGHFVPAPITAVPQPPPSHWTRARPFYRRLRRIFMSHCNGSRGGGDGPRGRETRSLGFSPYAYTYNAPNTRAVLLRAIKSQSRVNLPDRLFKTFYAR